MAYTTLIKKVWATAEPDSTYPEEVKQDACNRQVKSCGDQCGCKDKDTCKDK